MENTAGKIGPEPQKAHEPREWHTKKTPLTARSERARAKEYEKLKEKLFLDGWEATEFHEAGTGDSFAAFRRQPPTDGLPAPSPTTAKSGTKTVFWITLGFFLTPLLASVHAWLPLVVGLSSFGLLYFLARKGNRSTSKDTLRKIRTLGIMLTTVGLVFGLGFEVEKRKADERQATGERSEAKVNEILSEVNAFLAAGDLNAARKKLSESKTTTGEDPRITSMTLELEIATSESEQARYLGTMPQKAFDTFVASGNLPPLQKLSDPGLNAIFMKAIVDAKPKASKIRKIYLNEERQDMTRRQAAIKKVAAQEAAQEATKRKEATKYAALVKEIGPRPESSGWDGSVRIAEKYLKSSLKDPDSLKDTKWGEVFSTTWGKKHYWVVGASFRAKNGFGGYSQVAKWFFMRNGQVEMLKDSSEVNFQ